MQKEKQQRGDLKGSNHNQLGNLAITCASHESATDKTYSPLSRVDNPTGIDRSAKAETSCCAAESSIPGVDVSHCLEKGS